MKISFKPIIDNSEQLNLRISPGLKQRIENLRTRSKALALDFNATLVAYVEDFVTESESQLDALEQSASKSVAQQAPPSTNPATKFVSASVANPTLVADTNGADSERG